MRVLRTFATVGAVFFSVILGTAACALAADAPVADPPAREGAFTISPMLGGYLFEGDQKLKQSGVYSLQLGYNFTDNLGVEVGAGFINAAYRARANGGKRVAVSIYHMDVLYHITNIMPELQPYVEVGAGATIIEPSRRGKRAHTILNYGAGVEYFVTPAIAARMDVRDILRFGNREGGIVQNLMYTVGMTYMFGGKNEAAPAEVPQ